MAGATDKKLVFGRDQVLTSTQASKNFDESKAMAVEHWELREERLYALAGARVAAAEADPDHEMTSLEDVMGRERYGALLAAEAADSTPDSELLE